MATIGDLLIKLGIQNDASAGLNEFSDDADKAGSHASAFGSKVDEAKTSIVGSLGKIVAAVGITSAAFEGTEFLKGAIEGAEGLTKAQESLDTAITSTGGSVEKYGPLLDKVAKSAAEFGVSQQDATLAMARGTLIAGSAEGGMMAYQEALVLSKGAHISLQAALMATGKAQAGVLTGLTRYGVVLKAGSDGQEQYTAIMKRWGGQAQANTLASDQLNAKFQNMQAQLGQFILPYFLKFTDYMADAIDDLTSLADWIGKNSDVIAPFAAAIGAVVVAIGAWKIATAAWTAVTELAAGAQEAFNAVLDANPIGVVVVALVALGAGLVVLYQKSQTFRDIVNGVWASIEGTVNGFVTFFQGVVGDVQAVIGKVQAIFEAVKDWLTNNWMEALLTLFTGLPGLIWIALNTSWGKEFLGKFKDAWNGVTSFVSGIVGDVVGFFEGLPAALGAAAESAGQAFVSKIGAGLSGLGNALTTAIKDPINAVIRAWDSIGFSITLPSINTHIPGIGTIGGGSISFHVPQIPQLAIGTNLVSGDGLAYLHAGEAVVPANVAGGGWSGGGGDVVLMVDGQVLGSVARKELTRTGRRNVALTLGNA